MDAELVFKGKGFDIVAHRPGAVLVRQKFGYDEQ